MVSMDGFCFHLITAFTKSTSYIEEGMPAIETEFGTILNESRTVLFPETIIIFFRRLDAGVLNCAMAGEKRRIEMKMATMRFNRMVCLRYKFRSN